MMSRLLLRGEERGYASISFAGANAVLEKTTLHRIARQLERNDKMFTRALKMAATNLKFAERGMVERIVGKTLWVLNRMDLFQPALRPFALRDGNRPVEGHDW